MPRRAPASLPAWPQRPRKTAPGRSFWVALGLDAVRDHGAHAAVWVDRGERVGEVFVDVLEDAQTGDRVAPLLADHLAVNVALQAHFGPLGRVCLGGRRGGYFLDHFKGHTAYARADQQILGLQRLVSVAWQGAKNAGLGGRDEAPNAIALVLDVLRAWAGARGHIPAMELQRSGPSRNGGPGSHNNAIHVLWRGEGPGQDYRLTARRPVAAGAGVVVFQIRQRPAGRGTGSQRCGGIHAGGAGVGVELRDLQGSWSGGSQRQSAPVLMGGHGLSPGAGDINKHRLQT